MRRFGVTVDDEINDMGTYGYGFVYGYGGPAFDFGDLRHDNGSARWRADEMQRGRTKKGGVRQVTRSDTYSRRKVLKACET